MSKTTLSKCITILALLFAAACEPQTQEVIELPTLAVLPSLTPSDTPTPTFTPSDTPTLTPTLTSTFTLTPTFTLTYTLTPTLTFTPSLTPTETLTPTPTETFTPVATATPPAPQITSFGVSPTVATPNTQVNIAWIANADAARIDVLNQQGAVVQTFPVASSGQLPYSMPGNLGSQVVFRLVAMRSGQEVSASVPVQVQCQYPWFFGNEFAPSDAACPEQVGKIDDAAYQSFQRGRMIWLDATDRVYGLMDDGNLYIVYNPDWDPGDDENNEKPDNSSLQRPRKWFNWVWHKTNAPIGSWRSAIGWATGSIQEDTDLTIQYETGTGRFYINTPSGSVYRFSGGDSGTFTKIK